MRGLFAVVVVLISVIAMSPHLISLLPTSITNQFLSVHFAANICSPTLVASFVESDPSLVDSTDSHQWTPLMYASYLKGNGECLTVIDYLVANGADVNSGESGVGTALHHATRRGADANVARLLERGARVEVVGEHLFISFIDPSLKNTHL